jgi:hypothetical protein
MTKKLALRTADVVNNNEGKNTMTRDSGDEADNDENKRWGAN